MAFAPRPFADLDIDAAVNMCRVLDGPIELDFGAGPTLVNGPNGIVPPDMIPLKNFTCVSRVQTIFDELPSVPNLDMAVVFRDLRAKNYINLPDELKPAAQIPIPLKMQMVVLTNPDGTHYVLKSYHLVKPVPVDIAKSLVVGTARSMQMLSVNPKLHRKTVQWLLEQMGGLRMLWFRLDRPPAEAAELEAIDKGYDFIEQHGPRDSTGTKQMRWLAMQQWK